MAFKRTTTRTFSADVKVPVAREDGGYDMNTFKAIFEHTTTEEAEKLRELSNSDLVRRKLKGWELTDAETKEDVPFTPENLEAILQIPPSPMKICIAFWEQVNGARAKNS
jgi:hypothetical protein